MDLDEAAILNNILFGISLVDKVVNREEINKRKEENELRLSKLSAQERYDEEHRNFLLRMSR